MKITREQAERIGKKLNVNFGKNGIDFDFWVYGLNIELEHGKRSISSVAKIVLDHLDEYSDYYQRLQKMEKRAEKYWKTHTKKQLFIK